MSANSSPQELKSLRDKLIQRFHPDKAVNEADRVRLTEIAQRINAAYEAGDYDALMSIVDGSYPPGAEGAKQPKARKMTAKEAAAMREAAFEEKIAGSFDDGTMFELVYEPKTQWFEFVVRRPDGTMYRTTEVEGGPKIIVPPIDNLDYVRHGMGMLPQQPTPYGTPQKLIDEIYAFLGRYLALPELDLKIVGNYIMMTWLFDRYQAVPYLRLLGPMGTGKSHILKSVWQLAYRGIYYGGTSSMATLFRTQHVLRGTSAMDETEFGDHMDVSSDPMIVLKEGYSYPGIITRCSPTSLKPEFFSCFGPKIFASITKFRDDALENRCLTIETQMRSVPAHVSLELGADFYEGARLLRNKLLHFRFDHWHSTTPDHRELRKLTARRAEIGTPIFNITPDETFKMLFLAKLCEEHEEARVEDPNLLLVDVLAAAFELGRFQVRTKSISLLVGTLAGKRRQQELTFGERTVNRRVYELGFRKPKRSTGGLRVILLDSHTMHDVRRRFARESLPADVVGLVTAEALDAWKEKVTV